MKKGVLIFWGAILAVIVLGLSSSFFVKSGPGKYDKLAMCIKEQGVIFYGAFWCPHCQRTKAMFGSSAKLLPYEECSTPDGKGQLQICKDKKVESYPTWVFADGSRLTGERTLQELSEKSGCVLPHDDAGNN